MFSQTDLLILLVNKSKYDWRLSW